MIDIKDVMQFAMKAHGDQMYGNLPYITHLSDVYRVLLKIGIQDVEILSTAWLHDVLEDTAYHYSAIVQLTNKNVAEMVYAITDELGRNRRERKEKTWPKLIKNEKAIVVKQADMLANVNQGIVEGSSLLNMYKKEYPAFKKYFGDHGCTDLWEELNRLIGDNLVQGK